MDWSLFAMGESKILLLCNEILGPCRRLELDMNVCYDWQITKRWVFVMLLSKLLNQDYFYIIIKSFKFMNPN